MAGYSYASGLMGGGASSSLDPQTAEALTGKYSALLAPNRMLDENGGGFKLALTEGGPLTPGERSIMETIVKMFNQAEVA